jgi:hypothetical protein
MFDLILFFKPSVDKDKLQQLFKIILKQDDDAVKKHIESLASNFTCIGSFPFEIAEIKSNEIQNWSYKLGLEIFSKIEKQKNTIGHGHESTRNKNTHN